jgi:rRNA processing protein Gar1
LRKIGRIEKVTRSRNFLVKAEGIIFSDPKDAPVISEDLRMLGIVRDVIGPADSPYLLVKILVPLDKASEFVGKEVYIPSSKKEWRTLSEKIRREF